MLATFRSGAPTGDGVGMGDRWGTDVGAGAWTPIGLPGQMGRAGPHEQNAHRGILVSSGGPLTPQAAAGGKGGVAPGHRTPGRVGISQQREPHVHQSWVQPPVRDAGGTGLGHTFYVTSPWGHECEASVSEHHAGAQGPAGPEDGQTEGTCAKEPSEGTGPCPERRRRVQGSRALWRQP